MLFSGRVYFGSDIITYLLYTSLYLINVLGTIYLIIEIFEIFYSIRIRQLYCPAISHKAHESCPSKFTLMSMIEKKNILIEVLYSFGIFSYNLAVSLLNFDVQEFYKISCYFLKDKICYITGEKMRIKIKIASLHVK